MLSLNLDGTVKLKQRLILMRDTAAASVFVRFGVGMLCLLLSVMLIIFNRRGVLGLRCLCWIYRVSNISFLECISFYMLRKIYLKSSDHLSTILKRVYLNSDCHLSIAKIYSVDGEKVPIYRDVIVLKLASCNEKGVVLVKYTPAFNAFYRLFDVNRLLDNYFIVLEPSWAGACDPSFLIFWSAINSKQVIIQAIEPKDFAFIKQLRGNFVPINLGSPDWVDSRLFYAAPSNDNKLYDIVMVSNWGIHKNHKILFSALSKLKRHFNVLLIGYSWNGRTQKDIERESSDYDLRHICIEYKENLTASEVSSFLRKSKVYILLSRKEGGNKALVEALYSNVPAIVFDKFIGGAQTYINEYTGRLSSYRDLPNNIVYMVDHFSSFQPREWITRNSGSTLSTTKLNTLLRNISCDEGLVWTTDIVEKINCPNLAYKLDQGAAFSCSQCLTQYLNRQVLNRMDCI